MMKRYFWRTPLLSNAISVITMLTLLFNQILPIFSLASVPVARAESSSPLKAIDRSEFTKATQGTGATVSPKLAAQAAPTPAPSQASQALLANAALTNSPLRFVENAGQFAPEVRFRGAGFNGGLNLTTDGLWLMLFNQPVQTANPPPDQNPGPTPPNRLNLKLSFDGANPQTRLEAFNPLDTHTSFLIGDDPKNWHTDVPVWGGVRYVDLYSGINLEVSDGRARLVVQPGADLSQVQLRLGGGEGTPAIEGNALVRISTSVGDFTLPLLPVVQTDGSPVVSANTPQMNGWVIQYPFATAAPSRRPSSSFTPANTFKGLAFSTFLGGTNNDAGNAIARGADGALYVTGSTSSQDFITTTGVLSSTYVGGTDAFVTKFNASGTIAYSTYLGGSGADVGNGIAVDGNGNAYVTGGTGSIDFPLRNAYQTTKGVYNNVFLAKLNALGSNLLYSTYLGGNGGDTGYGVAVYADHIAYVTGSTGSTNFPTSTLPLAYQPALNGSEDAFVAKIDSSLSGSASLLYSTYFGGSDVDEGHGIALNAGGDFYVAGWTEHFHATFPTGVNSYTAQAAFHSIFVAQFSADGLTLKYTALVGSGNEDYGYAIAVDNKGMAYATGRVGASNLPTTAGAYQPNQKGSWDAFVMKLDPTATLTPSVVYLTYLGGSGWDEGDAIAVDADGSAYVTGLTGSTDFPLTKDIAYATACGASCSISYPDVFVAKLDPAGSTLLYGTYLGGDGNDAGAGIAVGANHAVYLVGDTTSTNFPHTSGSCGGCPTVADAFVTSLVLPVRDTSEYNAGTKDPRECNCASSIDPGTRVVKPINTRTGGQDYTAVDMSIPALGGPLMFERSYASPATDIYTTTLGYGWTHNQDTRLILPPVWSVTSTVLFKAHSANQYTFFIGADNTFAPYPGVTAQLISTTVPAPGYIVTATDQATYRFNPSGVLQSWSDHIGHTWTYTYTSGALTKVADSTGQRYLNLAYDGSGRLTSVSDPLARSVRYGYDVHGDLAVMTDTRGFAWTYLYTGTTHLLSQIIDPLGQTVERTDYDAQGHAVRQFDALNVKTIEITYNPTATATFTDALGSVMTHTYDARGTLINVQDAYHQNTARQFDANFHPSQITDQNGHATQLSWSGSGATLNQVVDPLEHTTTLGHDSLNNLTQTVDALGHTTTFVYSGTLLTKSTDALGNTTLFTYTNGFMTAQTDARGNTSNIAYNVFGQRTSMSDAQGNTTSYAYDLVGRLITTTDTVGRLSVNAYDNGDHLIKTTQNYTTASSAQNYLNQYNLITQYGYDAVGRRTLITDTVGRATLNAYDAIGRLVKATQNYTTANGTQNWQNQYNLVTQYGFDLIGNPTLITDTLGRVTRTDYDSLRRPVTVTVHYVDGTPGPGADEDVRTVTTYDAVGNATQVRDSLGSGRVTRTDYDALNRPVTVTVNYVTGVFNPSQPDNDLITVSAYDAVGNVSATTDPLGHVTRTYFDALNRPISTTVNYTPFGGYDPNQYNLTTRDGYDQLGNRVLVTDTLGRVTKSDYDTLNRLVKSTQNYSASLALGYQNEYNLVTQYGFDAVSRQTLVTDTLSRVTLSQYDALNRTLTTTANYTSAGSYDTSQYNVTSRSVYDAIGNRTVMTDALGNATSMAYDALNRVITTTHPLAQITVSQYDALGNRQSLTDPRGNQTQYGYDNLNRSTSTTPPGQPASTITYDLGGRQVSQSDGLGHATTFGNDNADRQTNVSDALSHQTKYGYDALGNRLVMTDANGIVTHYGFDAVNRLGTVIENYAAGGPSNYQTNLTTNYAYDALGNRLVITDARGYTTTFGYDTLNRLKTQYDALNNNTSYAYDAASRRTQLVDAKNQTTQYAYDALSRLASISYVTDGTSVLFGYDALGNRLVMTDTAGSTRYAYDSLYRLTQVTDPFTQVVSYQYDAANNRTNLTYPDGKVVTYTYSVLNLLASAKDWAGNTTGYAYDNANRLITTTLPTGVSSVNAYDNANRLTRLTHSSAGANLGDYQYALDAVGNRTAVTETLKLFVDSGLLAPVRRPPPSPAPARATRALTYTTFLPYVGEGTASGKPIRPVTVTLTYTFFLPFVSMSAILPVQVAATTTINYVYDPLYRVTSATSSGTYTDGFAYAYDAVGNRTVQTRTLPSTQVITYTYDYANRLTNVGGVAYTWDNNGNLLNDGVNTSAYDQANRLITRTVPSGLLDGCYFVPILSKVYSYNGLGDRLKSSDVVSGTNPPEVTTYTLDLSLGLTQVLADAYSTPCDATNNTYLYGAGRIAQLSGGATNYFLADGLGSVRQLTDEAGKVALATSYEPYGDVLHVSGYAASKFGFAGEQTDSYVGLQYLRARYYAPGQGRFVTKDTWQGNLNLPMSLNAWVYVTDNPVNLIDPLGFYSGEPIHAMIQAKFEATWGLGHNVMPEFFVASGSKTGTYLVTAGQFGQPGFIAKLGGAQSSQPGYIDLVDATDATAYEIKNETEIAWGIAEIEWYVHIYNTNPNQHQPSLPLYLDKGTNYTRWPAWELIGLNPYDTSGTNYLIANMQAPGVITYRSVRPIDVPVLVPAPLPNELWNWNKNSRQVERRPLIWNPTPAPAFCPIPNLDPNVVQSGTNVVEWIAVTVMILKGLGGLVLSPGY